jgi:hypothetical protein
MSATRKAKKPGARKPVDLVKSVEALADFQNAALNAFDKNRKFVVINRVVDVTRFDAERSRCRGWAQREIHDRIFRLARHGAASEENRRSASTLLKGRGAEQPKSF